MPRAHSPQPPSRVGQKPRFPRGGEFGPADQVPDLVHRLHTGDHDALGPHVQQPQHGGAGDLVGPGQGRQPGPLGRLDLEGGGLDAGGGVLRVHDHIVQPGVAEALHCQGAAHGHKGAQGRLSLPEFFQNGIFHGHWLLFRFPCLYYTRRGGGVNSRRRPGPAKRPRGRTDLPRGRIMLGKRTITRRRAGGVPPSCGPLPSGPLRSSTRCRA